MTTQELRARPRALSRLSSPIAAGHAVAGLALAGVVGACALLTMEATLARTRFVASSTMTHSLPGWLVGPLSATGHLLLTPLGFGELTGLRYTVLFGAMALCYVAVLALASHISLRWALTAIIGVHLVIFLGPPMLSADVFGYIAYARLGALHGFAPYLWGPGSFPTDSVFAFLAGWKSLPSPYGPLFTLASYVVAPLPVPVALWAFKLAAVAASLGCVGAVVAAARRLDRPPASAALFVGLNPLLLEWAVGGAHNDLMAAALVSAAVYLVVSARQRAASAALAVATAVKATAAPVFFFAVLGARDRRRALLGAVAATAVCAGFALAIFGGQVLGYVHALDTQGRMVAAESLPNVVSWLLAGGSPSPSLAPHVMAPVAVLAAGGFLTVAAVMVVRTWRGADWITSCGWSMLALLMASTWLLPWYVVWVLPFAGLSKSRALRYATLGFSAYIFCTRIPMS